MTKPPMENKAYTPEEYESVKLPKFETQCFSFGGKLVQGPRGEEKFLSYNDVCDWFNKNWPIIRSSLSRCATPSAGWQPIESAPRDGTAFLAAEGNNQAVIYIGFTGKIFIANTQEVIAVDWQPTHWQALPEPLKGIE